MALVVVVPLMAGLAGGVLAQDEPLPIDLQVSPNVLNLESYGGSLSMHTDVGYSWTLDVGFTVDGQLVDDFWTKSDARGELVVKASLEAVEDSDGDSLATFVLTVITSNGTWYEGTDTIRVISVSGPGRVK
jgi:hypothetical protein